MVLVLDPPTSHTHVPRGDTKRLSNVNIVVQNLCLRLCVSDYILVLGSRFHSVGHDVP